MSESEALHIRVGGIHFAFTSTNPLKALLGRLMAAIGYLPLVTLHGQYIAPRGLALAEIPIHLETVTPALAGLRIGLITDIHHEPHRQDTMLARAVALLNAAQPDVVLLGGDYVNSTARAFAQPLALLADLYAPLGTFAVLGNHDYWAGGDYIAARLSQVGVTVLRNTAVQLPAPRGGTWWLVGVDSTVRGHDDLNQAFAGIPPKDFRVVLAHEPDAADGIIERGFAFDLQLSGHTHGGQLALPLIGSPLLPRLGRRYVRGLHPHPAVYTSRGLGTVPPYLRFNCAPEVAILTLVEQDHNEDRTLSVDLAKERRSWPGSS